MAWAPLNMSPRKIILGGMIVPHHLLVKDWMERFYEKESLKYPQPENSRENDIYATAIERIILLSPNHFGYGYDWIQSTDIPPGLDIIPGQDVWPANLPSVDARLDGHGVNRLALAEALNIELTHFYREHGITTEFPFIERFFYGAYVLPITFKEGTPQTKLDALVEELIRLTSEDPRPTLVIASIDFTHMEEEKYALQNDERTIQFLESLNTGDPTTDSPTLSLDILRSLAKTTNPVPLPEAVAMDSPETLYVLLQLMHRAGHTQFALWDRTSSASLIPGLPAQDNTSHIFGSF